MSAKANYFDIQEQIERARNNLSSAQVSLDTYDVLRLCDRLLDLIEMLNEKDAPQ